MLAKCHCQHCRQNIEFDLADFIPSGETASERIGQKISCPHCGANTILGVKKNGHHDAALKQKVLPASLTTCPDCGGEQSVRAVMCPHCGSIVTVRFGLVWRIVCWVTLASSILALIGAAIGLLFVAAAKAWQ